MHAGGECTCGAVNAYIVELESALTGLLAVFLEVSPQHLDPKDVMRLHRPSYDVLYTEGRNA